MKASSLSLFLFPVVHLEGLLLRHLLLYLLSFATDVFKSLSYCFRLLFFDLSRYHESIILFGVRDIVVVIPGTPEPYGCLFEGMVHVYTAAEGRA